MTEKTAGTRPAAAASEQTAASGAATEFERLYRANVDAITAYFARRTADPQLVADLTADTFVAVITGFASFDPRKGTARAWLFGIAGHVYAAHCQAYSHQQQKLQRLGDRVVVVPVGSGCPSIASLPAPAVQPRKVSMQASVSSDGSITVDAHGIPAGDILVVGFATTGFSTGGHGIASGNGTVSGHPGDTTFGTSKLTSGQAPRCVSIPAPPDGTVHPGGPITSGTGISKAPEKVGSNSSGGTTANSDS